MATILNSAVLENKNLFLNDHPKKDKQKGGIAISCPASPSEIPTYKLKIAELDCVRNPPKRFENILTLSNEVISLILNSFFLPCLLKNI